MQNKKKNYSFNCILVCENLQQLFSICVMRHFPILINTIKLTIILYFKHSKISLFLFFIKMENRFIRCLDSTY